MSMTLVPGYSAELNRRREMFLDSSGFGIAEPVPRISFTGNAVFKDTVQMQTIRCEKLEITDASLLPAPSRLATMRIPTAVASLDDADDETSNQDPVICVDIARCLFYTRQSTLKRLPYFEKVLRYNRDVRKTQMMDRDPALFELILRYLRSNMTYDAFVKGWCANDLALFSNELLFYGLGGPESS